MIKNFLNPEGYQNPYSGSKVMVILLKGGFGLLLELHGKGSAPAACAAGLFLTIYMFSKFLALMVWTCDKFSFKSTGAAVLAAGVFPFSINFSQQCPVVLSNAFPKTCHTISSSFDPAISDNRKLIPNSLVLRCCIPQLAVVTGRQDADFLASFADGSLHSWDGGEQEKEQHALGGSGRQRIRPRGRLLRWSLDPWPRTNTPSSTHFHAYCPA